jgi:hypothetical protein
MAAGTFLRRFPMKKQCIAVLIAVCAVVSPAAQELADTPALPLFGVTFTENCLSLDEYNQCQLNALFKEEAVDYLLENLREKYKSFGFISEPPAVFSHCVFYYDRYILSIFIDSPKYIKIFDLGQSWNIEDFKKEIISNIIIKKR